MLVFAEVLFKCVFGEVEVVSISKAFDDQSVCQFEGRLEGFYSVDGVFEDLEVVGLEFGDGAAGDEPDDVAVFKFPVVFAVSGYGAPGLGEAVDVSGRDAGVDYGINFAGRPGGQFDDGGGLPGGWIFFPDEDVGDVHFSAPSGEGGSNFFC